MANLKNIRSQIKSVTSIQKVTTYDARGLAGSNIGLIKLFSLWTGGLYEYDREKIDADIYQSATMAFVRSLSTKSKEIEEFNIGHFLIGESISNGLKNVSDTDYMIRIRTCNTCDKLSGGNTCSLCGCYMPTKARWEVSDCPLNKWKK